MYEEIQGAPPAILVDDGMPAQKDLPTLNIGIPFGHLPPEKQERWRSTLDRVFEDIRVRARIAMSPEDQRTE